MRMLRTPPFFPPKSGENHIRKYFPDSAHGAIFWIMIYKQQFLHSDSGKNMSINPRSVEFHQCHAKRHSIGFYHTIKDKDNERNLSKDLLTMENTDSDLRVHSLHYANELLVRVRLSFRRLLQTRLTCRNNTKKCLGREQWRVLFVDKTTDHETTINHISICFLPQYQRQRKCFFFRARAEKGIARHIYESSVVWTLVDNGLVIFYWLVLSMRMQVILDSIFARTGSAPIWGGKKGEFRDWTMYLLEKMENKPKLRSSRFVNCELTA